MKGMELSLKFFLESYKLVSQLLPLSSSRSQTPCYQVNLVINLEENVVLNGLFVFYMNKVDVVVEGIDCKVLLVDIVHFFISLIRLMISDLNWISCLLVVFFRDNWG